MRVWFAQDADFPDDPRVAALMEALPGESGMAALTVLFASIGWCAKKNVLELPTAILHSRCRYFGLEDEAGRQIAAALAGVGLLLGSEELGFSLPDEWWIRRPQATEPKAPPSAPATSVDSRRERERLKKQRQRERQGRVPPSSSGVLPVSSEPGDMSPKSGDTSPLGVEDMSPPCPSTVPSVSPDVPGDIAPPPPCPPTPAHARARARAHTRVHAQNPPHPPVGNVGVSADRGSRAMAGSGLVRESPFKPLGEETASKFKKSQSIFEAYGAGIEAVTGTSWTPPTSKSELDAMGNLTRTYGRVGGTRDGSLLEGEALFSWLTTIAKAYATATQEAWRFQRGYAPSKCAEWLMAGSPVAIPTTAHRASGRSAPTQPSDLGKIENPWGGMDTDDDCFDSRGRYIGRRRQTTQEAAE